MSITIYAPDLARALRLVKHAAADDEARPIIATILFECDEQGFRLVAADNYRLGIAKVEASGDVASFGRVPLPIGELPIVLALLAGWKEAVTVSSDGERLTFATKVRSVTVRAMQGTYPAYEMVVAAGKRSDVGINLAFFADLGKATKDAVARIRIGAWNTAVEVVVADLDYREFIMPIRLDIGQRPVESPEEAVA